MRRIEISGSADFDPDWAGLGFARPKATSAALDLGFFDAAYSFE